jgi:TolB-like protein
MLVVLPIANFTGAADGDYFTDGLTEELTAQLGRLNPTQLGVIAFTTARRYRNTDKGIDRIGEEIGVDFIVEGSARRAGDRVRITAQLIRVSDQSHLWAEAYNRKLDDIIEIQIDVAERVAQSLSVRLLADNKTAMERHAARNVAAYEAYLKGRYYFQRRTDADFMKALRHLEEAIAHDPAYVPAFVGLADLYNVIGLYGAIPSRQACQSAAGYLHKALELDPTLAEAHISMAYLKAVFEWDFAAADNMFNKALEMNPNYAAGQYGYALVLGAMGRFEDALDHIEQALRLDPLSLLINCNKGWILYLARRYNEAETQIQNAIEMDSAYALARYFHGLILVKLERFDEANAEFARAQDWSAGHPASISGQIVASALAGKRKAALKHLGVLEEMSRRRYVSPYYVGLGHAALGDLDAAFACLQEAFADGSAILSNLKTDPELDALRPDPRFAALLKRDAAGDSNSSSRAAKRGTSS